MRRKASALRRMGTKNCKGIEYFYFLDINWFTFFFLEERKIAALKYLVCEFKHNKKECQKYLLIELANSNIKLSMPLAG